jgi:hypothetical protein
MEESPFPYQGPLQPDQVRGRDDLIADLIERVTGQRVTALLGPRRYGKTSVLRRVAAELGEVSTVWVDLYEVTSTADVAVRFDDALASARGPVAELASRFALSLSLNVGLVKVALSGRPGIGPTRPRSCPACSRFWSRRPWPRPPSSSSTSSHRSPGWTAPRAPCGLPGSTTIGISGSFSRDPSRR